MFRKLIVLSVLALSACASYPDARYGARQPIYSDGSYYSPSAEGYGDYYYAPESSGYYDDFYDPYYSSRFGYGSPFWGSQSAWCPYGHHYGYVYRPCSYGFGYGRPYSGWGLSLFFGDRWGWGGGWGGGWSSDWPYHHRHHRNDDDRDDGPRRPRPPSDGDRNQRRPDESIYIPQRRDDREPGVRSRPPPGDRNGRPRNEQPLLIERPVANTPPPMDRNRGGNLPPRQRDDGYAGGGPGDGSRNLAPRPDRPVVRVEPRPTPVQRPRQEPTDSTDRNERRRDEDRPEPRSRPRLQ